jgi:hypothetical protein
MPKETLKTIEFCVSSFFLLGPQLFTPECSMPRNILKVCLCAQRGLLNIGALLIWSYNCKWEIFSQLCPYQNMYIAFIEHKIYDLLFVR